MSALPAVVSSSMLPDANVVDSDVHVLLDLVRLLRVADAIGDLDSVLCSRHLATNRRGAVWAVRRCAAVPPVAARFRPGGVRTLRSQTSVRRVAHALEPWQPWQLAPWNPGPRAE